MRAFGLTGLLVVAGLMVACGAEPSEDPAKQPPNRELTRRPPVRGVGTVSVGEVAMVESPPPEPERLARVPHRLPSVPHRSTWPERARAVSVEDLGLMSVSEGWISGLDSLRTVVRSENEWTAFWRPQIHGRAPAVFPDQMLLLAGRIGGGPTGFSVDSAVVDGDTLFVVLGPYQPCPTPGGDIRVNVGLEMGVFLGRMHAFEGPVVFVEPKECLAL